jgi:hypothetical protein
MNAQLLQSLVKAGAPVDGSLAVALAEYNRKHPWFAAGHFLQAVLLYKQEQPDVGPTISKGLLYSNDQVWFDWQFRQATAANTDLQLQEDMHHPVSFKVQDEQDAIADALALLKTEDEAESIVETAAADAEVLIEAAAAIEELNPVTEEPASEELVQSAHAEELPAVTGTSAPEPVAGNESFLFEPYHTVDYFASQGIRLQEEKLGTDNLSKQVKTFTQWLRSMKKIYTEEHHQMEQKDEADVLGIANHSNQPEEVLTETMARVLQQQGKKRQAAEIYRKLSLLHPEKSAYFASLLHDLNNEQ